MNKKIKKLLASMLVVMMGFQAFPVMAATEENPTPNPAHGTLTVSSPTVAAGGQFDVTVQYTNNPGVAGYAVKLNFDKTLMTPVSITKGSVFTGDFLTNVEDPSTVLADLDYVTGSVGGASNVNASGTLFTVKFSTKQNTYTTESALKLTYKMGDIANQTFEGISPAVVDGKVKINGLTAPAGPTITVGSKSPAAKGDVFQLPVNAVFPADKGVASFDLDLEIPEGLTLESVVSNLPGAEVSPSGLVVGKAKVNLTWVNDPLENCTTTGALFLLNLKATTATPGAYVLKLTEGAMGIKDKDGVKVAVTLVNGTVTIPQTVTPVTPPTNGQYSYSSGSSSSSSFNGVYTTVYADGQNAQGTSTNNNAIMNMLNAGKPIILDMGSNTNVFISGSTFAKLVSANQSLTLVKGNLTVVLSPEAMKAAGLTGNADYRIVITPVSAVNQLPGVIKKDVDNQKLLDKAYDVKIFKGDVEIKEFPMPIKLKYNFSGITLSDAKKNKLTLVRVLGTDKMNKLGGDMIDGEFVGYTSKLSVYGMIVTDSITKIVTKIGATSYTVNGSSKTTDVAPSIISDRTMVPLRFVAESLGASVGWNSSMKTATIALDNMQFNVAIGKISTGMDVAPVIKDDRTLVPLRYISEQLGANVIWDAKASTITIYK